MQEDHSRSRWPPPCALHCLWTAGDRVQSRWKPVRAPAMRPLPIGQRQRFFLTRHSARRRKRGGRREPLEAERVPSRHWWAQLAGLRRWIGQAGKGTHLSLLEDAQKPGPSTNATREARASRSDPCGGSCKGRERFRGAAVHVTFHASIIACGARCYWLAPTKYRAEMRDPVFCHGHRHPAVITRSRVHETRPLMLAPPLYDAPPPPALLAPPPSASSPAPSSPPSSPCA